MSRPDHIVKVENEWRGRLAQTLGREMALRKQVETLQAALKLHDQISEAELRAENERLTSELANHARDNEIIKVIRAENERLRKEWDNELQCRLSAEGEVVKARAENERLRAALRDCIEALGDGWDCVDKAKAALGEQAKG